MDPVSHELAPEQLRAHELWLRRLARSLSAPGSKAEDLAQETWLAALRARPEERGALRPWLASVLRTLFAKQRRGAGRAERRERLAAREEAQPSCVEALIALEQQEQLLRAVRSLEEPHRQLILWRYYEERSPRAIAAELGIEEGAARMRLSRALAALRAELGVVPRRRAPRCWMFWGAWWMSTKTFGAATAAAILVCGAAWWLASAPADTSSLREQDPALRATPSDSRTPGADPLRAEPSVAREEIRPPEGTSPASAAREGAPSPAASADDALIVQVVDAQEAPRAGFPIAIGAAQGEERDERVAYAETLLSDECGRVHVRGVSAIGAKLVERLHAKGPDNAPAATSGTRFFVAPTGLALSAPRVPFDPRALPSGELRLVVAACGAVRVHLRDGDRSRRVRIEARALPWSTPESSRRWSERPASSHLVSGELLELRGVALGHVLHFTAIEENDAAPPSTLEARGPSAADETTELALALAEPYPAIVGRLLLPTGSPVASAKIATRLQKENEGRTFRVEGTLVMEAPSPTQQRETDARGTFCIPIDEELALSGATVLEIALRAAEGELQRYVGWSTAWPLPAQIERREHDAGALVLQETPLLAAGTVIDPLGQALAGAQVVALVPSSAAADATSSWTALTALRTTSDEQGRFELRGRIAAPRFRLRATRKGYAAREEPEVAPPTRDLRILLDVARELIGDVRMPAGLLARELELRLHRDGRVLKTTRLSRAGTFRFDELSSTALRVSLWSTQGNRELWSLSDVVPHLPGESDPRLQAIPLDGFWQAVPLRILYERDEILASAWLEVHPLDGESRARLFVEIGKDGRVVLLVHATTTQLYLDTAHTSGAELSCRKAEQDVRLAAPIDVELELEDAALQALREERVALELTLLSSPHSAVPASTLTRLASIPAHGHARVRLPLAGRYRASWHRVESQGPLRAYRTRPDDASEELEIAGGNARRVRLATPAWMR